MFITTGNFQASSDDFKMVTKILIPLFLDSAEEDKATASTKSKRIAKDSKNISVPSSQKTGRKTHFRT